MPGPFDDILSAVAPYISHLFGGPQTNPNAPAVSQPQQVQNLASAGFPGAQQMAASQPASQAPSGVTGFLANPLTQGALGAYFNAIGSPRRAGLGGMLSRGGIGGLQGFSSAYGQQLESQKQAQEQARQEAELKLHQQTTNIAQSAENRAAAKPDQILGVNKSTAVQIKRMFPGDPEMAALAESVAANNQATVDIADVIKAHDELDPNKKALLMAQIQEAQASAGASAASAGASTAKAAREAAVDKSMTPEQRIRAAGGIADPKEATPLTPVETTAAIVKSRDQLSKEYDTAHPLARIGSRSYEADREAFIEDQLKKAGGTPAGTSTAAVEALAARIPPGAKPAIKDGHHGYVDATGAFTALD